MNIFKSVSLWLYVLIAVFTATGGILGSDEAKEMIDRVALFYLKGTNAVILALLLAAKMYLSRPDGPPPPPLSEPPKTP